MRTFIARNRTAAVAADILEAARSAAASLVEREHRRTMSRMLAYENVAAMVGASGSWLRKFVNGYADAKPDLVVGMNLLMLHARMSAPASQPGEAAGSE